MLLAAILVIHKDRYKKLILYGPLKYLSTQADFSNPTNNDNKF